MEGTSVHCPTHPAHGRLFQLASGRWFCSHHEHDTTRTRAFFTDPELDAQVSRPRDERVWRSSRRRGVEGG